jgi:electron transfer flavoprotein alpha subunit
MSGSDILVWSEKVEIMRELLGKARQCADAAGGKVAALQVGAGSQDWGQYGADVVYQAESSVENHPEYVVAALAEAVRQLQPGAVLVGGTKLGLESAPRVAERTQSGYAAWMVDFSLGSPTTAQCMLYSGTGMAEYAIKSQTVVFTSAPGVFTAQETPGKAAQTAALPAISQPVRMTILENRPKAASGMRLEDANLVIDVGQGVKQREDLEMVQSLAGLLDGQLGCSRPVASDRDWFPEWLGLSGKKVSPDLCLTLGISGSIQHLVGIRDSRLIAAVNSDENAPIFGQSDYGVVADLYAFVPALMERIKARGVHPAWK